VGDDISNETRVKDIQAPRIGWHAREKKAKPSEQEAAYEVEDAAEQEPPRTGAPIELDSNEQVAAVEYENGSGKTSGDAADEQLLGRGDEEAAAGELISTGEKAEREEEPRRWRAREGVGGRTDEERLMDEELDARTNADSAETGERVSAAHNEVAARDAAERKEVYFLGEEEGKEAGASAAAAASRKGEREFESPAEGGQITGEGRLGAESENSLTEEEGKKRAFEKEDMQEVTGEPHSKLESSGSQLGQNGFETDQASQQRDDEQLQVLREEEARPID
jgi:hypothetical protein